MTYYEQYKKAKEDNKTVCLTTLLVQWVEPGMEVIGKIIDSTIFAESEYEEEVKKYLAETDDGQVSFILGAARDLEYKDKLVPGAMFYIRFNGKKPTKSNKTFNEFVIEVWNVPNKEEKDATKSKGMGVKKTSNG